MSRCYGYAPRLMKAPEAARYLSISESKLQGLDIRRKVDGGNRLYDIRDLDAYADSLPYEGEQECKTRNEADAAFGMLSTKVAA